MSFKAVILLNLTGKKRHIISYLGDFLFPPERALTPVKALSGGERNRLFLARLFSKPSNLLVLDEPTNDLDIETLELLEEILSTYQGTLLLVSHDRTFLDNVVTSIIAFEGQGKIEEYIGGYHDWLRQSKTVAPKKPAPNPPNIVNTTGPEKLKQHKKLSYKEQKELDELPLRIEKLEAQQIEQQKIVSTSRFYQQDPDTIAAEMTKLKKFEADIKKCYERWSELENTGNK